MSEPVEVPFSPALKTLIGEYAVQFNVRVQNAVNAEATHLGYGATGFDIQKMVWLRPDADGL